MKNIQIPVDLFLDLCNYHLAGIQENTIKTYEF